jgi:capsule polysaccharide export protein KpsE/RkpR
MIQESYESGSRPAEEQLEPMEDSETPLIQTVLGVLTRLASHKRFLLIVMVICVLVGLAYCFTIPAQYSATTRILTPQQTSSSTALMMNQMAANIREGQLPSAVTSLGLKSPNDIYLGLLATRPVTDGIIESFHLREVYRASSMETARRILSGNTKLISEKSGFILISVTDEDKQRSADIANAYTGQLRALTKSLTDMEASQRRLFYEDQLKHAKDDLTAAEISFQQVQQKKGMVMLDAQTRTLIAGLADLRAKIASKQVELKAIRSYSTDRNPAVQLAENQLAALQAEAAQLDQHGHASGAANITLQDVAGGAQDYLSAEHEVQYRQAIFDMLLKQYDAAKLDEAKYATVIEVVEPAIPSDQKVPRGRLGKLLMITILGFILACLYIFAADSVRSNRNLRKSLSEFSSALLKR